MVGAPQEMTESLKRPLQEVIADVQNELERATKLARICCETAGYEGPELSSGHPSNSNANVSSHAPASGDAEAVQTTSPAPSRPSNSLRVGRDSSEPCIEKYDAAANSDSQPNSNANLHVSSIAKQINDVYDGGLEGGIHVENAGNNEVEEDDEDDSKPLAERMRTLQQQVPPSKRSRKDNVQDDVCGNNTKQGVEVIDLVDSLSQDHNSTSSSSSSSSSESSSSSDDDNDNDNANSSADSRGDADDDGDDGLVVEVLPQQQQQQQQEEDKVREVQVEEDRMPPVVAEEVVPKAQKPRPTPPPVPPPAQQAAPATEEIVLDSSSSSSDDEEELARNHHKVKAAGTPKVTARYTAPKPPATAAYHQHHPAACAAATGATQAAERTHPTTQFHYSPAIPSMRHDRTSNTIYNNGAGYNMTGASMEAAQREAAATFRRTFIAPPGSASASAKSRTLHSKASSDIEKHAREILKQMTAAIRPTTAETKQKTDAWSKAAMAWREKNKPSAEDVKRRKEQETARASDAARHRLPGFIYTTAGQRAQAAADKLESEGGGTGGGTAKYESIPCPPDDASEADWRSFFRSHNQSKVDDIGSFTQVLRIFNVPCPENSKLKDAYRLAVRMYHPDSNSREKVWSSERERAEAEEIMKIINDRKPSDL